MRRSLALLVSPSVVSRRALALAAALSVAGLPLPASWAQAPHAVAMQVALLDLKPVGVSAEVAQNLTGVIAAEVSRYDDVKLVTFREIASLLDMERKKQVVGCSDEGCIAQIAGTLGLSKMLSGELGLVEDSYVLTLHLVDTRTVKVDARASRTTRVDAHGLMEIAKAAVADLLGVRGSQKNQPPRLAVPTSLTARRGERVELDGSRCYDPDGDPLRFSWRQSDGPPELLDGAQQARASFEAGEPGTHTFVISVTDGRSAPVEQEVKVNVLDRRRFQASVGVTSLQAFNRLVEKDLAGNMFQNRAPWGPALRLGLQIAPRWTASFEAALVHAHFYREDGIAPDTQYLDLWALQLLVGASYEFPFDAFSLLATAQVGIVRNYFYARQDNNQDDNVRNEAVMATGALELVIPFGDRFGIMGQAGLSVRSGTDQVAPFQGITFGVAKNGYLWGVQLAAMPFVRF